MMFRSLFTRVIAEPKSWARAVVGRKRLEKEMDAELASHLGALTDDLVRAGHSREEATRRARIAVGAAHVHKEEMRASLGLRWGDEFFADLRHGARILLKSPGFTAIAVVSLALGIGANTAIFSVAKKVMFDTLPVSRPHELRLVTWVSGHERPVPPVWGDVYQTPNGGLGSDGFSYRVVEELRKHTDVIADLIAFKDVQMTATVDGAPELVTSEMVSGNVFDALGVTPLAGRGLTQADDAGPGSGPVAVISENYWARRFGRSADAVGKTIALNGVPVTIVGVGPAHFNGLQIGAMTEVFVPLTMQPVLMPRVQQSTNSLLNNPLSWWVQMLVRLRPDVPEAQAQAALDVVLRQTATATLAPTPALDLLHLQLEPGDRGLDYVRGQFMQPSFVLLALAGLVLLLACVNLANLLLARAAARQREMSTRLALGAGRGRILRQVLTESLLLSGLGGAAGLLLGFLGRNLIPRLIEDTQQPSAMRVDFDWRVIAFTIAVSLGTGILFGVAPAWRAMHADSGTAGKDAERGSGSRVHGGRSRMRLGKGLVVFQIALSAILLIGAGLFVRTLVKLGQTPLGFRSDHLLLFRLNPPQARYTEAHVTAMYKQLEEKLAAIPGVRSASMSNIAIIGDGNSGSTFHVLGTPKDKEEIRVQTNTVGTDFFTTMGIPIVRGRGFNVSDTATSPKVAIVNRALAKQFFPGQDALGKMFESDPEDVEGPVEIIGICPDTRYADLRADTPPTFYIDYRQKSGAGRMVFEIQTAGEPASVLNAARAVVASMDHDLPLTDVRTMQEQVASTMVNERMFAELTSGFGLLALVLASVGIYGIMAYSVASRTSEIGIRLALGAQPKNVRRMILRESGRLAGLGAGVGVAAALVLTRLVKSMLYGVEAWDPLSLAAGVVVLLAVALAASWIPARRAAGLQPMEALRHE
jgi:predicted permease